MISAFRATPLAAALLLSLAVTAPLAPHSAKAQAANAVSIDIKNFSFMPMTTTVPVGSTVTWTNKDEEPHTVTSLDGLFRSGAIDGDESFKFTFTKAGTYKYTCSIHPQMRAAIVVK